jgi:hypothetical protein
LFNHAICFVEDEETRSSDLTGKVIVLSVHSSKKREGASKKSVDISNVVNKRYLLKKIPEPTRRRNEYVNAAREQTPLLMRRHSTNNRSNAHRRW